MATYGRQFSHLQELLDYLNDVIVGQPLTPTLDLDGLTLILGATTITFVGHALTPNQIVVQINAAVATAASLRNYGQSSPPQSRLAIVRPTTVVQTTGTANALLGLPTSGAAPVVGADAVAHTDIIQITEIVGRYTVVHE
jgi:hypothetical protein